MLSSPEIPAKLELSRLKLVQNLGSLLSDLRINLKFLLIEAVLRNGTKFYIRYNIQNEYSYSILFSDSEFDRCRFDNFDEKWRVKTRPHHFHPRLAKMATTSPMTGKPEEDMVKLSELLKSKLLYSPDCKF